MHHVAQTAADLAGFTQWSSTRQPEDVFTLLETLYNAFDKIAVKWNVFKVRVALKRFFGRSTHVSLTPFFPLTYFVG